MSFRNKTWQDIVALDEHLTVFLKLDEALERFLEDFGFSSHEAYKIGMLTPVRFEKQQLQTARAA